MVSGHRDAVRDREEGRELAREWLVELGFVAKCKGIERLGRGRAEADLARAVVFDVDADVAPAEREPAVAWAPERSRSLRARTIPNPSLALEVMRVDEGVMSDVVHNSSETFIRCSRPSELPFEALNDIADLFDSDQIP